MAGDTARIGVKRISYRILVVKYEEKWLLGKVNLDERIILKWMLEM
jgi:hypothetical protein